MWCSILLTDEPSVALRITAPSLLKECTAAIDPTAIEPAADARGLTISPNAFMVVRDIETDPACAALGYVARRLALRTCWSHPITASDGNLLLGALTIYYRDQREPNERELGVIKAACPLAGIAIERKRAEEKIRRLALYDTLTGLPNRYLFKDMLARAISVANHQGAPLAVVFLDLDGFKLINDTLGHDLGDELLQTVAARIKHSVRESDGVGEAAGDEGNGAARLGGDEFTLWLSNPREKQDAANVARRIIEAVARPIVLDGHEVTVTTSVGIALYPDDAADVESLLKCADIAMYHAKGSGKNRLEFYSQDLRRAALENARAGAKSALGAGTA